MPSRPIGASGASANSRQAPSTCTWASATGAEPSALSVSEISPGVSRVASTDSSSTGGARAGQLAQRLGDEQEADHGREQRGRQRQRGERAHHATSKWLIQPSSANSDWWAWNM